MQMQSSDDNECTSVNPATSFSVPWTIRLESNNLCHMSSWMKWPDPETQPPLLLNVERELICLTQNNQPHTLNAPNESQKTEPTIHELPFSFWMNVWKYTEYEWSCSPARFGVVPTGIGALRGKKSHNTQNPLIFQHRSQCHLHFYFLVRYHRCPFQNCASSYVKRQPCDCPDCTASRESKFVKSTTNESSLTSSSAPSSVSNPYFSCDFNAFILLMVSDDGGKSWPHDPITIVSFHSSIPLMIPCFSYQDHHMTNEPAFRFFNSHNRTLFHHTTIIQMQQVEWFCEQIETRRKTDTNKIVDSFFSVD